MKMFKSTVLCIALVAAALPACAQQKARPGPADAAASVAAAGYDSAFSDYVKDSEVAPAQWKEVNDEVGRIGGHAGYMRGATGNAVKPAVPNVTPAAKPSPPPVAPGHVHQPK